jgi:hypothetical protein
VELIVKVDPTHADDPARYVTRVLRAAGETGRVEEVFPGLRSGASAGLVSVSLTDTGDAKTRRATLKLLRGDAAIAYVHTTKPRRPLG